MKTFVPTCDECTQGVEAVAAIIGSEGKIVEIIDFLKVHSMFLQWRLSIDLSQGILDIPRIINRTETYLDYC